MTRKANPDISKRILEEAEAIVVASGFEAINMRALAKRVGVSATIIYHYFQSKEELLYQLRLLAAEKLNAKIRGLENHPDPHTALNLLGKEYISFAETNPELYRLLLHSNTGDVPFSEKKHPVIFYTYFVARKCLERMAEKQKLSLNPSYDAMMGWVMLHGFSSLLLAGNLELVEGMNRKELKEVFFKYYTREA
jgi:AcrR family transcriptional regulator